MAPAGFPLPAGVTFSVPETGDLDILWGQYSAYHGIYEDNVMSPSRQVLLVSTLHCETSTEQVRALEGKRMALKAWPSQV